MKAAGLAFELVGLVLTGMVLGYFVDHYWALGLGLGASVIGIIVAFIIWIVRLFKWIR